MKNNLQHRCLCCYKELVDDSVMYHPACAHRLFGSKNVPLLTYTRDNIEALALQVLERSMSVTGVQPKLSLDVNRGGKNEPDRFTIVGLWGNYILKPQSPLYRSMPELEDVTMLLAEAAGISVARHGLIRMGDGEIAYITRRMDRSDSGRKISMLDMCQLTNRLTEHKYRGTYTQLADTLRRYSASPLLDVQRFWEIVVFSWITGNSDMHCKNFSLIHMDGIGYQLSPAYDLLSVRLTGINDNDELAMPLYGSEDDGNGIIGGFIRKDFVHAMELSGISGKYADKIINRMIASRNKWMDIIDISFLSEGLKADYRAMIDERLDRLHI